MSSRRGQGRVYRPTYRDRKTGKRKQSNVWWIGYSINGTKHRESSGTTVHREAVRLLHQRLAERGRGVSRRDLEKVTFDDLADVIRADYQKNGRKSARRLNTSLIHLSGAFGDWRVVDLTEDVIDRYATDRLDEGAASATVNRELAALRRMLVLGRRARMVGYMPAFEMLHEDNVRTGFLEDGELSALEAELPEHLRPLAQVAYCTGWRRGELLSRRWRHVDLENGWLRLEPGETKNGKGRSFPLIPRLRAVLEEQHARKLKVERSTGRIVDALFFRFDTGEPIGSFRKSWKSACTRAGVPDLLFHDFRRSAVRNLIRAGIPETIAMRFTGHITRSVFDRYAIVDEKMLQEQSEKLTEHYKKTAGRRKVVPLGR